MHCEILESRQAPTRVQRFQYRKKISLKDIEINSSTAIIYAHKSFNCLLILQTFKDTRVREIAVDSDDIKQTEEEEKCIFDRSGH